MNSSYSIPKVVVWIWAMFTLSAFGWIAVSFVVWLLGSGANATQAEMWLTQCGTTLLENPKEYEERDCNRFRYKYDHGWTIRVQFKDKNNYRVSIRSQGGYWYSLPKVEGKLQSFDYTQPEP